MAGSAAVHDLGPPRALVGDAIKPNEQALGLAYDFNTDHLFLLIAPANVIRVVERPSGKVLRAMPLAAQPRTGPAADLAIRSSDRHLFVLYPEVQEVAEVTLRGEFVRQLKLTGLTGMPAGLAYDQQNNRLLLLMAGPAVGVGIVNANGQVTPSVTLREAVQPVSLGFDSVRVRYFVPLADPRLLGEFDAGGILKATHAMDAAITATDAGPRSMVRVF